MEYKKLIQYTEYLFTGFFFTGIFIFFAFFYNSHLHFAEQVQLFLMTDDYFLGKVSYPGGFAGYTGEFLTQFYFLSLAGPLIISVLLFAIRQMTKSILKRINPEAIIFPLSFLPALGGALILCDEFYPLSAVTGILIALLAALLYINISYGNARFISGLLLILVIYWLAGGSYLMLLAIMIVYELILNLKLRREISKGKNTDRNIKSVYGMKVWHLIAYLFLAGGFPLIVQKYLVLQPVMLTYMSEFYYNIRTEVPDSIPVLFALPALLMIIIYFFNLKEKYTRIVLIAQVAGLLFVCWYGFRIRANFNAEVTMTYDHLVRNERWNEVLKYVEKEPPRNYMSLAMLNLSLAKSGQMGNRMFNYDQHGINGLFLPFNREYVAPMMGNEILYHLGLINASQQYIFESMETIPNMGQSVRAIKRLAETNLINGHYRVSEKYLKMLENTIFYRRWAKETNDYLWNEEKINNHSDYGEKRKFMVRSDYFFHIENIEAALNRMVKENPGNRMAFEYLMAFYLVKKDLGNFLKYVPMIDKMNYREIPVSYQEAMMFLTGLSSADLPVNIPLNNISESTKSRIRAYVDIYNNYPDAEVRLRRNFSGTYWYYLHFKELENNPDE